MTKDVLISISGLQMDVLEEEKEYEPIEVVAPANYFLKNGKHYILFDEVTEGIPGITKKSNKDYRRGRFGSDEERCIKCAHGI